MITKKELQEIARFKGLSLGNAEKDYLIDIALFSIAKNTKNELIFKGGTCLYKFYKLNRFSEDLDFSAVKKIRINSLLNSILVDFRKFGINAKVQQNKEAFHSTLITLRIEGPLYDGRNMTLASIGIDINFNSPVMRSAESRLHNSAYPEIPNAVILCMTEEEIFAEKIRTLLTRKRARDLFDIYFLLSNNVHADVTLIKNKMEYYGTEFKLENVLKNIGSLKSLWKPELEGFTQKLPDFETANKSVSETLLRLYKRK